jgi:hypothetical protein
LQVVQQAHQAQGEPEEMKLPDQMLADLRRHARRIMRGEGSDIKAEACHMSLEFQELDRWLSDGGYLPTSWAVKPKSSEPESTEPCQ